LVVFNYENAHGLPESEAAAAAWNVIGDAFASCAPVKTSAWEAAAAEISARRTISGRPLRTAIKTASAIERTLRCTLGSTRSAIEIGWRRTALRIGGGPGVKFGFCACGGRPKPRRYFIGGGPFTAAARHKPTRWAVCGRLIEIAPRATKLSSRRRTAARPALPLIALNAEHTAGARVGIEPQHTAVWGEPFEAVVRLAGGTEIGSLDIGKIARASAANIVKNLIQRANFTGSNAVAGPVGLRHCRLGSHGCAEEEQREEWRRVPHRPFFIAVSLNSA
jgi:hypothetical protein